MNFFLKIFKFLPPEFAHSTSLNSLNFLYKLKLLGVFYKKVINQNEQNIFGMKFKNKLGTAAGLDKNKSSGSSTAKELLPITLAA